MAQGQRDAQVGEIIKLCAHERGVHTRAETATRAYISDYNLDHTHHTLRLRPGIDPPVVARRWHPRAWVGTGMS